MKLKPVITEKTTEEASRGRYTFLVDRNMNKFQIKNLVENVFDVHVTSVATISLPGEKKRTMYGRIRNIKPGKKAIVTLKDKEKIDIFETKKK